MTKSLKLQVIGQKLHACNKIIALVNEVRVLCQEFKQCNPNLFLGTAVDNIAFKLARDAIISQITWPEDSPMGKNLKETCTICFENTDVPNMFSIDKCLHRYCFSCMKNHVEAKLHDGVAVKCPHDGCSSEIAIELCGGFLEPNLVSIMSERMKEAALPAVERVYCPYPRCSALMSKQEGGGTCLWMLPHYMQMWM
ncbi:hypothetical protein SAY87_016640 [Trapa incisa]|uniref:RING-type domain-containing protein n=1 Tax=Trapa incisa TaxID=236973 RepID=A0AAN7L9M0_9MYRT|nr:hypothetical protein SAY87_016640 [Trapa incisa]